MGYGDMADDGITNRAIALARMWATRPDASSRSRGDKQLLRFLTRPGERDVAILLTRGLAGATTVQAGAAALEGIDPGDHPGLGLVTRSTISLGRTLAPYAPGMVAALARWRRYSSIGGLVIDGDALGEHIAATSARGHRVNIQVLAAPPATVARARDYARQVEELLRRDDVDYVSLTPTSLVPQVSPWDVTGEAERIAERLRPLLRIAQETTPHKFINLDIDTYASVPVTTEAFETVLSEAEFMHLSAGLTIQGYLPDSVEGLERLIDFATRRVRAGGAPLKVRLVKGGNLDGELRLGQARGWSSPTYGTRVDTDANHLRLTEMVLRPEVAYALRIGVATHNLFHVAHAHLLAQERGLTAALDVEMHHASGPVSLVTVQAGLDNPIVVSTPVLPAAGWDAATSQIADFLSDACRQGAFLADLAQGNLQDQEDAFLAARDHWAPDRPWRTYDTEIPGAGFHTTPPSDPSLARTREELVGAVTAGVSDDGPVLEALGTTDEVDGAVASAARVQPAWAEATPQTRDAVLRSIAAALASRRAELVAALCHETGQTITEADAEVSDAIDHAVHCAQGVLAVDDQARSDRLEFTPDRVVLVVPPRTSPVAAAIAGAAAALAAGSAVIVRSSGHTPRSAGIVQEALHEGLATHDIDLGTANVTLTDGAKAGRHLVANTEIDAVIVTGSHATAALFTSWRVSHERGPRVFAAAQGNNTIIVTPSADPVSAVDDILDSAFINAGQSCIRAANVIIVADQATAEEFSTHLVEALRAMRVDRPSNPAAQIGPLAAEATAEQRAELEELLDGERWLLAPQQLDDAGRLWRPGIRLGPRPRTADPAVPVLTLVRARTLVEALEMQNTDDCGLLGAIHSRSVEEINEWLAGVQVGSAYVNRSFRGPTVGRAPIGGWKRSVVGPGLKMGGPGFIGMLGQWQDVERTEERPQVGAPVQGGAHGEIGPRVTEFLDIVRPWLESEEHDWLEQAARSDGAARDVLRQPVDHAGVSTQVNALRYRPGPRVTIRAGVDARPVEVLRVYAAALATGMDAGVSLAPEVFDRLPTEVQEQWRTAQAPPESTVNSESRPDEGNGPESGGSAAPEGIPAGIDITTSPLGWVAGWRVETTAEFTTRASTWVQPGRIRCIGTAEVPTVCEAVSTMIAVLCGPVVRAGSRELLTFLREQSVSVWNLPAASEGKLDFIR